MLIVHDNDEDYIENEQLLGIVHSSIYITSSLNVTIDGIIYLIDDHIKNESFLVAICAIFVVTLN